MIWDSSSFGWGLEGTNAGGSVRTLQAPLDLPSAHVFKTLLMTPPPQGKCIPTPWSSQAIPAALPCPALPPPSAIMRRT